MRLYNSRSGCGRILNSCSAAGLFVAKATTYYDFKRVRYRIVFFNRSIVTLGILIFVWLLETTMISMLVLEETTRWPQCSVRSPMSSFIIGNGLKWVI